MWTIILSILLGLLLGVFLCACIWRYDETRPKAKVKTRQGNLRVINLPNAKYYQIEDKVVYKDDDGDTCVGEITHLFNVRPRKS